MVTELVINDTCIKLKHYEEEKINNLYKITVIFMVTSMDYHDITTLLYKGTFDVKIPERHLAFKASIQEYSTSITNLYERDQVGEFKVSLLEKHD
ncbi:DUF3219 family protein [Neobacillus cucumis]|uniref:DUF3219 domain-containing protein n=1 Tax=Neobacillus cucumis TaxID=1740721 RepID=A0A2N5HVJ6_9BACI|nr:DUF3219 family protein [Neobacillus cucumis]PLS09545.1 DUF3219 domain-containing protein [Neobacillus cucumis]